MNMLTVSEIIAIQLISCSITLACFGMSEEKQVKMAGMAHAMGTIILVFGFFTYFMNMN